MERKKFDIFPSKRDLKELQGGSGCFAINTRVKEEKKGCVGEEIYCSNIIPNNPLTFQGI